MINANELRIGNYVNYYQVYIRVFSINLPYTSEQERYDGKYILEIGSPDSFNVSIDEVSPIPLTEELLLRFGFKKQKCGISGSDMWQGLDFWVKDSITFRGKAKTTKNREVSLKLANYINTNFDYLHQLQNLYFALTGQELTLKN